MTVPNEPADTAAFDVSINKSAITTFGANNFLVNYEGGDGNDLTLTVQ